MQATLYRHIAAGSAAMADARQDRTPKATGACTHYSCGNVRFRRQSGH
jgi:hypothetical protein